MMAFRERSQIVRVWREIRRYYGPAKLIIRFDGDYEPKVELSELLKDPNVLIVEEPWLYSADHGGLICQRMLALMLETQADFLFKLDPDTQLRGPLTDLPAPSEPAMFGTIQPDSVRRRQQEHVSIQGGAMILSRAAAEKIYASRLLESDDLKAPALAWLPAANRPGHYRAYIAGMTSTDWALGWAARQLQIELIDHPQVMSHWRYHPWSQFLRYYRSAVVHPKLSMLSVFTPENIKQLVYKRHTLFQHWEVPEKRASCCLNLDVVAQSGFMPSVVAWVIWNCTSRSTVMLIGDGTDEASAEMGKLFHIMRGSGYETPLRIPESCSAAILMPGATFNADDRALLHASVDNLIIHDVQEYHQFRLFLMLWMHRLVYPNFLISEQRVSVAMNRNQPLSLVGILRCLYPLSYLLSLVIRGRIERPRSK